MMYGNLLYIAFFLLFVPTPFSCESLIHDVTYNSITDPKLKDIVDYSLMKIGDGAELNEFASIKIEVVHGLKYTMVMDVDTYQYDPYGSTKVTERCEIHVVDQPDLRWVSYLHCEEIDSSLVRA